MRGGGVTIRSEKCTTRRVNGGVRGEVTIWSEECVTKTGTRGRCYHLVGGMYP